MATGRMLQKRISNSRKMALLSSDGARLLYTWMLSHLDVNGCFYGDPVMVNNIVFTRLGKTPKEIQRYLDELEEAQLILRYKVDDEVYLYYPDFIEKQPGLRTNREGHSDIPSYTPEARRSYAGVNPLEGEIEGEYKVEGGIGNPTSLTPDCPMKQIVDLYHETLPELSSVSELTQARKAMLRSRWKENPERQNLEWWKEYFLSVKTSDFLTGKTNPQQGRSPFQADFEWLIRPANMVKVIEGKYGNRKHSEKTGKARFEE